MNHRSRVVVAVAVVLALLVAGCSGGDDESEAEQSVCDEVSTLEEAADSLLEDIQDLDFGAAQDQLPAVVEAAGELGDAVRNLGGEKRDAVAGAVNDLEHTLGELTSVRSLDDIVDTLDTAQSQLQDVLDSVTDTLSCG